MEEGKVLKQSDNTMGLVGFIASLVSLVFGWIPFIGQLIWLVGIVLSIIGVTKKPKGFAIAGIIISCIGIILFGFLMLLGLAFGQ
jgi:hypothetical protein